jgi:hypothetical protein
MKKISLTPPQLLFFVAHYLDHRQAVYKMKKKANSNKVLCLALFMIFILLTQLACSPAETAIIEIGDDPGPEGPTAPTHETYFEQDGIRLYYDPQLILDVEPLSETVPAASGDEMYEPAHPAYVHFDLYMEQAQVYIAPVDEYLLVDELAEPTVAFLQNMIEQKTPNLDCCIPELPLGDFFRVCGHQQFHANIGYLDFQNGSGVRFVSVYGIQDLAPVDNENLTYVYQGFTDDGKYYVKVIVRILHSQLPDMGEIPAEIYIEDATGVAVYFDDFALLLNQNEDDYAPALEWVDAFLASLWVE